MFTAFPSTYATYWSCHMAPYVPGSFVTMMGSFFDMYKGDLSLFEFRQEVYYNGIAAGQIGHTHPFSPVAPLWWVIAQATNTATRPYY
jgi:hypothetical protein